MAEKLEACAVCQQPVASTAGKCPHCGAIFPAPSFRRNFKRFFIGGIVLFVLGIFVVAVLVNSNSSSSSDSPEEQSASDDAPSIPYKLASIEAGRHIDQDDPAVPQFAAVLAGLEKEYEMPEQQIADQSVKAQQLLQAAGVRENLFDIMAGMNEIFSDPQPGSQFTSALAMYVEMRKEGQSHDDALQAIREVAHLNG